MRIPSGDDINNAGDGVKKASDGVATILKALGDFFVAIKKEFTAFVFCLLIGIIVVQYFGGRSRYADGKIDGMATKQPLIDKLEDEVKELKDDKKGLYNYIDTLYKVNTQLREQNAYKDLILKTNK